MERTRKVRCIIATYAAFLREEGLDYTMGKNADKTVGVSPAHFNPNAAFGKVYWVDAVSGSDLSDGLSPANAFATIATAITASNLTAGSYNMNTIYINASTYTEDISTFPNNCNVIGIGAKVRIQGTLASNGNGHNSRWWNIQVRENSANAIVTIAAGDHGFEMHNCRLEDQGACTIGLELGNAQDIVIDNCQIGMGSPPPIGIQVSGATMKGMRIINNQIFAVTTGINVTTAVGATYQAVIKGNVIEKGDPTGFSAQMAYGIKFMKTDGSQGILVVKNQISAVDAIYFAYTGSNHYQWYCLENRVGQGASPAWEDA